MLIIRNKYIFVALLLMAAFAVFCAYFPSLFHVSRGDHRVYLIETSDYETLPELVRKTYSFNRTRQIDAGDQFLFRPLLYIFMAFELHFFQYNFFFWQMMGLILHVLVLITLWRLLNTVWPSILSFCCVFYFSVLHITQDAVIWHHINAYLLSLVFILEALRNFLLFLRGHFSDAVLRKKTIVFLVLASFFNEVAIIICMIVFAVMFLRNLLVKDKNFVIQKMMIIPIVIFFVCNIIDFFVHIDYIFQSPKEMALSFGLLGKSAYILLLAFMFPFIPDMININESRRVFAASFDVVEIFNGVSFASIDSLINLILLVAVFLFFVVNIINALARRREILKGKKIDILWFGLASLCMSFVYILSLFIAREPQAGFLYLRKSLYHFYPIVLFQVIAFYCVIAYFDAQGFLSQRKKVILILLLCCAFVLNARQTHRLNSTIKNKHDQVKVNGQISNRQWYQKTKELIFKKSETKRQ